MVPPMDWRTRAQAAVLLAPDQLDHAASALSRLPAEQQAQAVALMQTVAAQAQDLEGFVAALALLDDGLPNLDPTVYKGGDPPAIAAAKLAALSALQGHAVLAGHAIAEGEASVRQARALLDAIDAFESFRPAQRSVLRSEARQGLGDALYVAALQG